MKYHKQEKKKEGRGGSIYTFNACLLQFRFTWINNLNKLIYIHICKATSFLLLLMLSTTSTAAKVVKKLK